MIKNKFIKDNLILFLSILTLNICNYLFQLYTGRKLGPVDYGTLASLLSIIYIFSIPLYTVQTSITNFVSKFKVKNEYGKIKYLLLRSFRKLILYGTISSILFALITPVIAYFLHIPNLISLLLLSTLPLLVLIVPINRGILQGLQNFKSLGISYIIEGIMKFLVILFIYLNWGVNGAILAMILAFIFSFIYTFFPLKKVFKQTKEKFDTSPIYKYSFPVLFTMLTITFLYTLDVLLVKHFFNSTQAGYYAAISLLGKAIFFSSISIGMVMFPKVTESYNLRRNPKILLLKSLAATFLFGALITSFYFIFPYFTVNLLFGKEYISISSLIGWFAIFATILSLIYILSLYNLSLHKTKFIYLLSLFNLTQIIMITLFHNTLLQVIQILLINIIILFLILIYNNKNAKTIPYNTSI